MTHSKNSADFSALRDAALEDLLKLSDAELAAELSSDGISIAEIAQRAGNGMRETAAQAIRLQNSRKPLQALESAGPMRGVRPSIGEIKKMVTRLFENAQKLGVEERSLGLAFRDGKKQTDADWETLYDDLVRLKAIPPENDH
ncbi:hypothetical protein [Herbaspirillum robiniae]|uniref:Uncharacterized protein n=1 Tax=Herbaspirillum robiniae TaxID=2014887 RepID=A0ABX2LZW4_9BURK|nr:hypothetical protein [Herbaspirillum robiniae]NUU03992.1 hypothetical protein [Herbaspirillum robiniae]